MMHVLILTLNGDLVESAISRSESKAVLKIVERLEKMYKGRTIKARKIQAVRRAATVEALISFFGECMPSWFEIDHLEDNVIT